MKKMYGLKRFAFVLMVLCLAFQVPGLCMAGTGAVENKVPHRVPLIDSKVQVDGVLDDEAWQKALKLEVKYETYPGENIPARVRTEVFVYYSQTHFYVGVRAHDPEPSAIRATYTDRDNIWDDDHVIITLDTFNDPRRHFYFFCNPLGIQADLIETIDKDIILWDSIWDSAGRIVETGYNVEVAIPFSSLRFQRTKEDQIWRFDVIRVYPRNEKHHFDIFPVDRNNSCYICQAERLIGFKGVKPGKNLEFDPSLTAVLTQEREDFTSGKFVKKESKLEPGITAHWGFTPNMTLNATINPDFSNVEADAAQLDINTQFALFYPEKRPFFLESASIFNTRFPVVYTRSLADPDWGIKLTGKEGRHTLGVYSAQDKVTNLLLPGTMGTQFAFLDMKSMGSVLRYSLDVGKRSTVGLMLTDREGEDYFNRLAGIDANIWLTPKDKVQMQFIHAQTRYPDQMAVQYQQSPGKICGSAVDVYYRHVSRNVEFYTNFQQIDPDFRADLGFITQAGYRNYNGGFYYSWIHNPGHWYNLIKVGPSFEYETDIYDNLIFKTLQFTTIYNGPAQSELTVAGSLGKRFFMGETFDTNQVSVKLNIFPSGALQLAFVGTLGDQIDFANIQQGRRILLNPAFKYKAGRHFTMLLDHVFERFTIDAGRLYTANVSNLRLVYQFNSRTFLRTLLRYINYQYNSQYYLSPPDPEFKHLFTQVLFSYKVNPRTVLFLGYSDDYYGFQQVPFTQTNRTIFLKIGYALVL